MTGETRRILVIKLGALGDFVLATGPFAAIRRAHPDGRIVLLTTAPYAGLAAESGLFDEIWIDERPRWFDLPAIRRLRAKLRGGRFDRVYDLQTSDRSGWYFRLFPRRSRPEWSGIAAGCSHPHANPARNSLHTIERQAEQLAMAGIPETPPPDLAWAAADISRFGLPARFAMMVPGGAAHRPAKRWPEAHYADIGRLFAAAGIAPVVAGGPDEAALAGRIAAACGGISLAGRTSFADLAALARAAEAAVGNDTGPMHIAATAGCRSVVLFSAESDPALTAPRGAKVRLLRAADLADLPVSEVAAALSLG
ncbi:MAG: glycosyltransferase family 9 protein [Rhodospirillaceae bacterium]